MAGAIWVVAEPRGDAVRRVSLEALGRAAALGGETVAVLLGADAAATAPAVAPHATRVLAVEHPTLADASSTAQARVLAELARTRAPRAILAGATAWGRDLLARLAARLGAGYVPDAVELSAGADGQLEAVRPVLGGRAYARLAFRGDGPWLVALRPNAYPAPAPGAAGTVERLAAPEDLAALPPRVVERKAAAGGPVDLAEADAIVAAGRGVRGPEGFAIAEQLAAALGGAVGASRAAVDAGWRDHAAQVGKSGRTVAPRLYVALGISGAVHHRMGMDTARTVVVINQDANAPFFKHADYGLVGDLFQLAPALAEEIRKLREK
ncbi:MAG: electron transfer flavoprotein subunit alpha/FixB family protein [Deltaproteobacteria bacterium]|nr:electron transfer flavoprotein subunit alpha/FixB family protein [Deltaproteobacteria bacterium]